MKSLFDPKSFVVAAFGWRSPIKVFSGASLKSDGTSTILLQNNLLSCHLPSCGEATAKQTSLAALGNQVQRRESEDSAQRAWSGILDRRKSAKKGLPLPLGRGALSRPNPKMGAPDPENPLFLGFCAQSGIETVRKSAFKL